MKKGEKYRCSTQHFCGPLQMYHCVISNVKKCLLASHEHFFSHINSCLHSQCFSYFSYP